MNNYVCPYCRVNINENAGSLSCPSCSRNFPVKDGIPVFFDMGQDNADLLTVGRLINELRNTKFLPGDTDGRFLLPDRVWDLSAIKSENKSFGSFRRYFNPSELKILVVSAGAGREVNRLLKDGAQDIYYTDISFEAVKYIKETAGKVFPGRGLERKGFVADAAMLPFRDDFFELLLVYCSIHHYPDIRAFVREAHRVAKNICILSEPAVLPVFQPLLELTRWDKKNDYSPEIDIHRIPVKEYERYLGSLYSKVKVQRLWTFYPRFLGKFGNNRLFAAIYFGTLRLLDIFFGWCSHSVNFYGFEKHS